MSIWPPVFDAMRIPGKREIEQVALETFGVSADDRSCPEPVMRWAFYLLVRIHSEGDVSANAKLDSLIAQAAADFKRGAQ